jgi:hypothetical protein
MAEADDQLVVRHLVLVALLGLDLHVLAPVLDPGDLALQHVDALEGLAVRCYDVAGVDRPSGRLGQEGGVRHVRPRVDDDDGRLPLLQLLTQAARHVEADGPAAEHHDARHLPRARRARRIGSMADRGQVVLRHDSQGTARVASLLTRQRAACA